MFDSESFPVLGGLTAAGPRFVQTPKHRIAMPEPKEVNATLRRLGGVTLEGKPRYRCVWGSSRTEMIYSRKSGFYEERPRYPRYRNRWIVEYWAPPGLSRQEWEEKTTIYVDGNAIAALGPYPHCGDYEYLWHAQTPHSAECEVPVEIKGGDGGCICLGGNYLQINVGMAEMLLEIVKFNQMVHRGDRKNQLLDREEKKRTDFDKIADDAINDAGRPFGGSYFVPMAGKSPDHWPQDPRMRFNPS